MASFGVSMVNFEDLTEDEKSEVPNNGHGKEYATYLRISHNEEVIFLASDAMEPEDCTFFRDLSWVAAQIHKAYELGLKDGNPQ